MTNQPASAEPLAQLLAHAKIRPQTLTVIASHLDARAVAMLRPGTESFEEWQVVVARLRGLAGEAPTAEPVTHPDGVVAYRSRGGMILRCLTHAPVPDDPHFTALTSDDLAHGGICTYVGCGVDVLIRERQAEAPTTTKPETEPCAHCGKTIRLITGTLAQWWVHEPGGHTICQPEHAASSPRATPRPAAGVRQVGAQS